MEFHADMAGPDNCGLARVEIGALGKIDKKRSWRPCAHVVNTYHHHASVISGQLRHSLPRPAHDIMYLLPTSKPARLRRRKTAIFQPW
jgi:hypothetical protein